MTPYINDYYEEDKHQCVTDMNPPRDTEVRQATKHSLINQAERISEKGCLKKERNQFLADLIRYLKE